MSREYTDTNSDFNNEPLPDGKQTFRVVSVRKHMKGETKMYFWTLTYGDGKEGVQLLLPSQMNGLLRLLGATEPKPNEFDWETELMEGKYFDALVKHEPDKKGVVRQTMSEFTKTKEKDDDIPF